MKIDLIDFFRRIRDISYIITKVETPYTPRDFPYSYPVGKDLDIIIPSSEYRKMVQRIQEFVFQYDEFGHKILQKAPNKESCFRYRLHEGKSLHYQFDVSYGFSSIPEDVVIESIVRSKKEKGYYVPLKKYELVYRVYYYKRKKPWHLEYVRKYATLVDEGILKRTSLYNKFRRMID